MFFRPRSFIFILFGLSIALLGLGGREEGVCSCDFVLRVWVCLGI